MRPSLSAGSWLQGRSFDLHWKCGAVAVPSVMGAVGWGAQQSSGVQLTATRSALAVCSLHCTAPSAQHVLCVLQCVFPGQCSLASVPWPVCCCCCCCCSHFLHYWIACTKECWTHKCLTKVHSSESVLSHHIPRSVMACRMLFQTVMCILHVHVCVLGTFLSSYLSLE